MYVITKKNTFEVQNEVYFHTKLDDALLFLSDLVDETGDEWIIAVVLS